MMKIGCLACFAYILAVQAEEPALLIGTADGSVVAAPQDWPAKAGTWNAKGARYHPASRRLVFETFRKDIVGGSIVAATGEIKAPGVRSYFVAGPGTGTEVTDGTTILYIAGRDGGGSYAIGERDCMDGVDGITMYMAAPSTTGTPQRPLRQRGASMYANRNKDLAAWHPNGKWIIAAVEMPRHALTHDKGNGETGLFNNLWAISADGKTWVQLTCFETTWRYFDPVAMLPYAAADRKNSPAGAWYASKDHTEPYAIFSASAPGEPPPASGIMRPVCGHHEVNGRTPVVWAERVGLSPGYVWGGTLQLAMANIVFVDGIPTLVNYRRSLTPTPATPAGEGLWANRDGNTVIGAGYEAWDISPDDTEILFASDVFFSGSHTAGNWPYGRKTRAWTQAFPDVAAWNWEIPSLENITAYRPGVYTYKDNAGSWWLRQLGHWEEPAAYLARNDGLYVAFASSADMVPAYNPNLGKIKETLGLDTWIVRRDLSAPAQRITFFNKEQRMWAYPTSVDPDGTLFLTVVRGGQKNTNPPGAIYTLRVR